MMKAYSTPINLPVCSGRGKSYCLVHKRYFETSWCPDCSRLSCKLKEGWMVDPDCFIGH